MTGNAGSIAIAARDLVHPDAGTISTSVGVASGGDITIDPTFVILEHGSRIVATSGTGTGGHIRINADHFFAFPGSVVSAASGNPELSGTVEIHGPDADLAGTLAPRPLSSSTRSSGPRAWRRRTRQAQVVREADVVGVAGVAVAVLVGVEWEGFGVARQSSRESPTSSRSA